MPMAWIIGGSTGLVGVICVVLGIEVIVSRWRWVSRARKADGKIIRHKNLGGIYVPIIEFVTEDGRHLEMDSNVNGRFVRRSSMNFEHFSQDMARDIGKTVSIFYDPLNKQRAFVAGTSTGGVGTIFFGAVWLAFAALVLLVAPLD